MNNLIKYISENNYLKFTAILLSFFFIYSAGKCLGEFIYWIKN